LFTAGLRVLRRQFWWRGRGVLRLIGGRRGV
jgi:hypothetical protein